MNKQKGIMRTMYIISNYKLTDEQINDAKVNWGVTDFIYLPEELQREWSNITPYSECIEDEIDGVIKWIFEELLNNKSNEKIFLVQGDFGATCYMVSMIRGDMGYTAVYATTERKVMETTNSDGSITKRSMFKHVQFRKYQF